jgi:hypothetical protein
VGGQTVDRIEILEEIEKTVQPTSFRGTSRPETAASLKKEFTDFVRKYVRVCNQKRGKVQF